MTCAKYLSAGITILFVLNGLPFFEDGGDAGDRCSPVFCPASGAAAAPVSMSSMDTVFTENRGQVPDARVRFICTGGVSAYFTPGSVIYRVWDRSLPPGKLPQQDSLVFGAASPAPRAYSVFCVTFEGSNAVVPEGTDRSSRISSYFIGNDPSRWVRDAPSFTGLIYRNLYDDIDLNFRASGQGLKYEFIVRPGGNPSSIRMRYDGARVTPFGTGLEVKTPSGALLDRDFCAYQPSNGTEHEVKGAISVRNNVVRFEMEYDPRIVLVIDPLIYSTFLGGVNWEYRWVDVEVDLSGHPCLVGTTNAQNFPMTPGSYDGVYNGGTAAGDVFVSKFNHNASGLDFSTYVGGSDNDIGYKLRLDGNGNVYVTGYTESSDFPTTQHAHDTSYGGKEDAFVFKLNSQGNAIQYSTYLGSTDGDRGEDLALDSSGRAVVTGITFSEGFPATRGAFQEHLRDWAIVGWPGDVFVTKLNDYGDLEFSTFVGGDVAEQPHSIALDSDGNVYVTGITGSGDFPVTRGVVQHDKGESYDGFVFKLSANGSRMIYSTFLGGGDKDYGHAIVVDGAGNAYLAGVTNSSDFPTTPGAFKTKRQGTREDAFVAALDPDGASLSFSTLLGGTGLEYGMEICRDANGELVVTGNTTSGDLGATANALDASFNGHDDGFLGRFSPDGSSLLYLSYIGGKEDDYPTGLALDPAGLIYISGSTSSYDFPVTQGGFEPDFGGGVDVFALKIKFNHFPDASFTFRPDQGNVSQNFSFCSTSSDIDGNIVDWHWDFGDGLGASGANQTHRFSRTGLFSVRLSVTDDDDETSSVTKKVRVYPDGDIVPTAKFTVTPPAGNTSVSFEFWSTSFDPDGRIVSHSWDFGDGSSGSGPDETHSYERPGHYMIQLTVMDDGGALAFATESLDVEKVWTLPPVANFTILPEHWDRSTTFQFCSTSYDPDGRLVAWEWDIGGLERRSGENASCCFHRTGDFDVRLTVTDDLGSSAFYVRRLAIVNVPPLANFTAEPVEGNHTTNFSFASNSRDPDGTSVSQAWDFGDGKSSRGKNVTHRYADDGNYTVTLTAWDLDGAENASTCMIRVNDLPPVAFIDAKAKARVGTRVILDASRSYDPDGNIRNVVWHIEGDVCNGTIVEHRFRRTGDHVVRATVTDDDGSASESTVTITVLPADSTTTDNGPWTGLMAVVILVGVCLAVWKRYSRG